MHMHFNYSSAQFIHSLQICTPSFIHIAIFCIDNTLRIQPLIVGMIYHYIRRSIYYYVNDFITVATDSESVP